MRRILVVDDEKSIRVTISEFLRDDGHEVLVAEDVMAATKLMEQEEYDVVLCDIILPRVSGMDLLGTISESTPHSPVIMMTGEPTVDTATEAVRAGAFDYLAKPVTKDIVLKTVRNALEFKKRGDEVRRLEADNRRHQQDLEQLVEERTAALRRANDIITQSPAVAFVWKVAEPWLVEYVSQNVQHLFGHPAEDFVNGVVAYGDVIHPDDLERVVEEVARASTDPAAKTVAHTPYRIVTTEGQTKWIEDMTNIRRSEDGSVIAYEGVVIDITERKAAEQSLRVSEENFRKIFDESTDGFLLADPESKKFHLGNQMIVEMTGYTKEEIVDLGVQDIHPEEDLPRMTEVFERLTRGESKLAADMPVKRKDGSVFHADINTTSVELEGKTYLMGTFRDITERKQMQASLAQSDRLASMGMLAAGVAHEINNPLCYILYNLESLTDDLPRVSTALRKNRDVIDGLADSNEWATMMGKEQELLDPATFDDIRARFKDALQGTQRIKEISRGLGMFSRADEDLLVPVNLMHVIEAAINMVFNEIKYRARLVKDYGKVSVITANDGRLSQVFLNLLINAAHAIQEGNCEENEIRVRTWQEGAEICAEIRDTGKGISPQHLPHLFEPFFTTKEIEVGTGLGLPISKNIVEGYGGHIDVSTVVGEGTSFVVRLPVRTADDLEVVAQKSTPPVQPEAHGRILVVDDEPEIRSAMVRMLRGNEVLEAGSGEEARKILETDQAFDLVLCDMMMPIMSGIDLHKWLLATHPVLAERVVFITGGAFTPTASQYLKKVDNIRLEKPFETANFKRIAHEMIVRSRRSK